MQAVLHHLCFMLKEREAGSLLHTQGKAIKLNGTMEKKKPFRNLVCVPTLLMVIWKCCLIKEQFPGYCTVNWIFLGYWAVSQLPKIFNLETLQQPEQRSWKWCADALNAHPWLTCVQCPPTQPVGCALCVALSCTSHRDREGWQRKR